MNGSGYVPSRLYLDDKTCQALAKRRDVFVVSVEHLRYSRVPIPSRLRILLDDIELRIRSTCSSTTQCGSRKKKVPC
jgi:hypothetical protein